MAIKDCLICGEKFLVKANNQVYCSDKICKSKRRIILLQEKLRDPIYKEEFYKKKKESSIKDYEKHKERCILNAKKLRYTNICKECWKEFKAYQKTLKVCSKECQSIWLKTRRIWADNPSYRNWAYTKDGDKKIHRKWDKWFQSMCREINKEMEEKFWYRFCEYCWINNSLRWEHHHIIFRSEKPWHEFLHDKRNTIHLCIKCHNNFHKDKNIRIPLIKERKLNELFWEQILFI